MADGNISHAEMWDDSELLDSWNDALEEYKVRLIAPGSTAQYRSLLSNDRSITAWQQKARPYQ